MIKIYHKTATIKAEQFDGSNEMIEKYNITPPMPLDPDYTINTLEGDMVLGVGDWIATGVNGEHWAIRDDVFKKTYEEAKFGCKYCQQDNVLMRTYSGDMTIVGNKLTEEVFWDDYNDCPSDAVMTSKINYCPMCGRKLEEE